MCNTIYQFIKLKIGIYCKLKLVDKNLFERCNTILWRNKHLAVVL